MDATAQSSIAATPAISIFDEPEFVERFVRRSGNRSTASLLVSGMRCAACAATVETRLRALPGVSAADVNLGLGRAEITWREDTVRLSDVVAAIMALGFDTRPYATHTHREQQRREASALLQRLGVALVFGIQVMMIALVGYWADPGELDGALEQFLLGTALLLSLPVVAYAALPFYRSAWHSLRAGAVNMDVPVSLAIILAFAGSCANLAVGSNDVYFDSVAMFCAFLLASRYLELRTRVIAGYGLDTLRALVPDAAERETGSGGETETVPTARLRVGDTIRIRAGAAVGIDGEIIDGNSSVDEAVLTGESTPQRKHPGARVYAGSVNLDSAIRVRVTAVAEQSFVGHISQLVQQAASAREQNAAAGSAWAQWFVVGTLLVAMITVVSWSVLDPARAFSATLAVLVAACPCALALARPAALTAAHAGLMARGVAVTGAGALERMACADTVMFDKTGTLTGGAPTLTGMSIVVPTQRPEMLALAASLADSSEHPLRAPLSALSTTRLNDLEDVEVVAGAGIRGRRGDKNVYLGSRRFITKALGDRVLAQSRQLPDAGGKEVWLAVGDMIAARFEFSDPLRAEVPALIRWLHHAGIHTGVLSGDRVEVVREVAGSSGIREFAAELLPAAKVARLRQCQARGETVVMVGDGVNDSPVMAAADVAVAVSNATAAAADQADILLLQRDLSVLPVVLLAALRLRRIVRQNRVWALVYNLCAVPLAASGMLAPWAAALGMSLSSLLVVGNAMRAVRTPRARFG